MSMQTIWRRCVHRALAATLAVAAPASLAQPASDPAGSSSRRALPSETIVPGAGAPPVTLSGKVWERVPGCAHSIAAGRVGMVAITGCDPDGAGTRSIWTWQPQTRGGSFVEEPPRAMMLRLSGSPLEPRHTWLHARARGLSIDAAASLIYAIGPDSRLSWRRWSQPGDLIWQPFIGSRSGYDSQMAIDAVAAGGGVSTEPLWVISSQPGGPGGQRIFLAVPCAKADNASSGRCWQPFGGSAVKVAFAQGVPWVVSADGNIFRKAGEAWENVPGCARDIAGNGDHVYVVGCANGQDGAPKLYRWSSDRFQTISMTARTLAVDVAGNLWVVKPDGAIWRQRAAPEAPPR